MKGYKMFDADWKCSGTNNGKKYKFQYRVGETYTHQGKISMCNAGFHFCKELQQCFNFYEAATWNHIAEVEALGEIIEGENKCVTNQIRIVREISFDEIKNVLSNGVNMSNGVNGSNGVNRSNGVNESYGILDCYGVSNALFLANKPQEYTIFGKTVDKNYWDRVQNNLVRLLNGWIPTFNNLKSLYLQYGSDWKLTPIPRAAEISKEEAWRDMPREAIEYIKSLPEFDGDMFYEITGIK